MMLQRILNSATRQQQSRNVVTQLCCYRNNNIIMRPFSTSHQFLNAVAVDTTTTTTIAQDTKFVSKYKDVSLNLTRPLKIILTIEEIGPANTEVLWRAVQERYPDAFESKRMFKNVLDILHKNRRVDAKRNPLEPVLKKKDAGFQYHLTLKERKGLLKKRKDALNKATAAITPEVVESVEQDSTTVSA